MTMRMTTCEAIWLHKLLVSFFGKTIEMMVIHCDNQSCIRLSENTMFHDMSKNIDMRYHTVIIRVASSFHRI